MRRANSARIGGQIADFTLIEILSSSGRADVFRADGGGRSVAIKVWSRRRSADGVDLHRFRREAGTVAARRPAGVVPILGFGDLSDGRGYSIMPLLSGQTLAARVRVEGPLALESFDPIARALVASLDAIHGAGVLHRDVNPDHVVLGPGDAPVLLGVAAARFPARAPDDHRFAADPAYRAPEVARADRGRIGAWSDVYALAATCYYALTGRPPYGAEGAALDAAGAPAPIPSVRKERPELPEALDALLQAALARQPAARPPGVIAFGEAWRAAVAPAGEATGPASAPAPVEGAPPVEPVVAPASAVAPPAAVAPASAVAPPAAVAPASAVASSRETAPVAELAPPAAAAVADRSPAPAPDEASESASGSVLRDAAPTLEVGPPAGMVRDPAPVDEDPGAEAPPPDPHDAITVEVPTPGEVGAAPAPHEATTAEVPAAGEQPASDAPEALVGGSTAVAVVSRRNPGLAIAIGAPVALPSARERRGAVAIIVAVVALILLALALALGASDDDEEDGAGADRGRAQPGAAPDPPSAPRSTAPVPVPVTPAVPTPVRPRPPPLNNPFAATAPLPIYRLPITGKYPTRGPSDALSTVFFFGEFADPASQRVACAIHRVRQAHPRDLRLVWVNLPWSTKKLSRDAALAALAVYVRRGAQPFWRFFDFLFAVSRCPAAGSGPKPWRRRSKGFVGAQFQARLRGALRAGGLHGLYPVGPLSAQLGRRLRESRRLARRLRISMAPRLVVNGRVHPYRTYYSDIKAIIAQEMQRARAVMARQGLARGAVYQALIRRGKRP